MDVLLHSYLAAGQREALTHALALSLDWIEQNPESGSEASTFAWYDQAVAIRAPYLAFILRAGAKEHLLSAEQAEQMLGSLASHGRFLAAEEHYTAGSNHGVYQDEGLTLLSEYLPFLPEAAGWRRLAHHRAVDTLQAIVEWDEGMTLEHSPAYHQVSMSMVSRLLAAGLGGDELRALERRLVDHAGWLVVPDGTLPEVGDTYPVRASLKSAASAGGKTGLRAFPRAGVAVVRDGDTYLYFTAGYHGSSHKHADELSFLLFSHGQRIVSEAGRYGYYERDPERVYARSSHAHNTLVVDDASFDWRRQTPYGSGLIATGSNDGWYGILGENALVQPGGVDHHRLLLLKPRQALLIIDHLKSNAVHTYSRFVHFGPDVVVGRGGSDLTLVGDRFRGALSSFARESVSLRTTRGQLEPSFRGWVFHRDRERTPVWTAEYAVRAKSTDLGLVMALRHDRAAIREVDWTASGATIDLTLGRERVELTIRVEGEHLRLSC